jgi:hypothetical protein
MYRLQSTRNYVQLLVVTAVYYHLGPAGLWHYPVASSPHVQGMSVVLPSKQNEAGAVVSCNAVCVRQCEALPMAADVLRNGHTAHSM